MAPTDGLWAQSDGRLFGGVPFGDGVPVTLAAVPSGPVLPYQQFPVLSVGSTEMPPWSHQKSTPFRWTLPFGATPILLKANRLRYDVAGKVVFGSQPATWLSGSAQTNWSGTWKSIA